MGGDTSHTTLSSGCVEKRGLVKYSVGADLSKLLDPAKYTRSGIMICYRPIYPIPLTWVQGRSLQPFI